jgi:hypothetical protein
MLRWLRRLGFRRDSFTTLVDRRLGLEAAEARVSPPPGLRGRTLAALRESSLAPVPARAGRRPVAGAYVALAGLALALAAVAVLYLAPTRGPAGHGRGTDPLRMLRLDTGRLEDALGSDRRLESGSWEAPLRQEARLLVADARQARAALAARLPRAPGG